MHGRNRLELRGRIGLMGRTGSNTVSLVIPCWKDGKAATYLAERWSNHHLIHDVVIAGVAGEWATHATLPDKVKVCICPEPSRGEQMNAGAAMAGGDILLFHHVDSGLTERHLIALVAAMQDPALVGGAFYRKFDQRHRFLRKFEALERWHCRSFGTLYGDQSVFVRRAHFQQLAGFSSIPLMEDVEFSSRLRRSGKIVLLDPPMESAPRQQLRHSAWATTTRNALFLLLYHLGVGPGRLHRWYYATPEGTRRVPLRRAAPACCER